MKKLLLATIAAGALAVAAPAFAGGVSASSAAAGIASSSSGGGAHAYGNADVTTTGFTAASSRNTATDSYHGDTSTSNNSTVAYTKTKIDSDWGAAGGGSHAGSTAAGVAVTDFRLHW